MCSILSIFSPVVNLAELGSDSLLLRLAGFDTKIVDWLTGVKLACLLDVVMGVDDNLPPCSTGEVCVVLDRVQVCVSDVH